MLVQLSVPRANAGAFGFVRVAQVEAQAVAEVVAGTGVVGGTPFGGDSVSVTRNSKLMTPVRHPKLSLINSKSSEHVNSVLQTFTAPKNMNITKVVTAMIMNVYLYHHHHLQCNDRVVLSASSGKIYVGAALTGRLVEEGGGPGKVGGGSGRPLISRI